MCKCLCCFEKRKTPACIMMFLSTVAIALGCLIIYFAAKLTGSDVLEKMKEEKSLGDDVERIQRLIFLVLVIFAVVGICVAFIGCCFLYIKNRCCVCTYAILLIPTWLIYIVFGGVAVWAATNSDERIVEECNKINDQIKDEAN